MWVKVTVDGPSGRHIEHADDVREKGELAKTIGAALDIYRKLYPEADPFDYDIKVTHA